VLVVDEQLEAAKERSWRDVAAIDSAYERGELDDAGWHAAVAELVVPAYLAAESAVGGSGSSRDGVGWEHALRCSQTRRRRGRGSSTSAARTAC